MKAERRFRVEFDSRTETVIVLTSGLAIFSNITIGDQTDREDDILESVADAVDDNSFPIWMKEIVEAEKSENIEIPEIPEAAKSGKIWEAGSKKRYYLSEGYYQAANAYFSTTEDSVNYCW